MTDFHYFSGETVQLGDKVSDAGHIGIVTYIIHPNTQDAADFSCFEQGGIMVESDWDGQKSNALWEPPDREFWEDLEFLGRKD